MAAPTISGYTLLNALDTNTGTLTGSSGTTGASVTATTPGVRGTGTQASGVSIQGATAGNAPQWYGRRVSLTAGAQQTFATDDLLSIAVSVSVFAAIATKANGGISVALYSNAGFTESAEYYIAGSDTPTSSLYLATYAIAVIQPSQYLTTADSYTAGFTPGTITAVEVRFRKNSSTNYIGRLNQLVKFSKGLTLVDGDSGSPGSLESFYTYLQNSTGAVLHQKQGAKQYFFYIPLNIGNGSTATRFETSNAAMEFVSPNTTSDNPSTIRTARLSYNVNTSASDYYRFTGSIFAASSKFDLQISGSSSADFAWDSGSISNLSSSNSLAGASDFDRQSFIGCNRIISGTGRSFTNCQFSGSTDTTAAFTWVSGLTITGSSFTGNTTPSGAILITASGTYTLSSNTFSGNTRDFVITAPSGTVTIVVDSATVTDKTWVDTAAGATSSGVNASGSGANVVFSLPSVTVTLTGLASGSEVRVYQSGTTTEIAGTESSGTSFSFVPTGTSIDIAIISDVYQNRFISAYPVPTSNTSIPIEQITDRNYENL